MKKRMHQKSMMKYSVKALLKTAYRMQIKIGSLHLVLLANEMEKNNIYKWYLFNNIRFMLPL